MAELATEEKVFDPQAHIRARNEADQAAREGKQVEPKPVVVVEPPVEVRPEAPKLPRSVRREMNRLREEAAEARGKLSAYEELGITKPKPVTTADTDPEPQRATFSTEGEFQRALGRWDARQETRAELAKREEKSTEAEQSQQWRDHVAAMETKAGEDRKLLKDWDEVAKAASGEDAVEFTPSDHPTLTGLIASSDVKAFVLYHFAKHQDELQAMLDLTKDQGAQIRAFHRLEGRIEKMYTSEQPAQGSETSKEAPKDRTHPAEAVQTAGRTAVDRDVHKPKPSAEVAARGGSAPPEEPTIGSKAWMERRNQEQYGRRS